MRIPNVVFAMAIFFVPPSISVAQAPSTEVPQNTAPQPVSAPAGASTSAPGPPAAPAASPMPPSGILQPSLDMVRQALGSVRVERWKRGSVRDEAGDDIHSIVNDMQANLPPLLQDADRGPGALSRMLPLSKHVDALYDVLLRVVEAARMAAPDDQANQLRDALSTLGTARLALDERMQQTAAVQEKQMVDLRVTVEKQAAFKCPAPPPPPDCPKVPAKKPVRRKPTTAAPTTQTPQTNAPKPSTTPQQPGSKNPPASQKTGQKPAGQQQPPASPNTQKTGP
jgi:hypothetical protein